MLRLSTFASRSMSLVGVRFMATTPHVTQLFINGEFVTSKATKFFDVLNPATQDVVTRTPLATPQELQAAVDAAAAAYPAWRKTPISVRQRVLFKYQQLLRENSEEIAEMITLENGKTLADARGDVFRGLEVTESACFVASSMMGETMENLASNVDTYSYRQPLGVCAGIAPFNFPVNETHGLVF